MSEAHQNPVGSDPCEPSRREEPMLQKNTVQEVLARLARGEKIEPLPASLVWIATPSSGGSGWGSGARARGGRGRVAWWWLLRRSVAQAANQRRESGGVSLMGLKIRVN
jgi:hypothetical protein